MNTYLLLVALLGSLVLHGERQVSADCATTSRPSKLTCASTLCATGTQCQMVDGTPQCVDQQQQQQKPTLTCANTLCASGTKCQMIDGRPQCTGKRAPRLTCATTLCVRGSQCQMIDGKPQCICNDICLQIYKPVCGTDDRTYGNECELEVAACKQKNGVKVAHEGECASQEGEQSDEPQLEPEQDLCAIVRCGWGARCQVVGAKAKCVCPQERCPNNIQGVCGSDGKTYATECDLRAEACQRRASVQVAHQGACKNDEPSVGFI